MNNEELIPFEKLPSKEQREYLENILNQVQLLNREKVIAGKYEIQDLSYNEMSDGRIIYDVTLSDPQNPENIMHEYYSENELHELSKFELPDEEKLNHYRALGADTTLIDNYKAELSALPTNNKNISLAKLEKQDKELEDNAENLGISKDDIAYYTKLNANQELGIDSDKINGIASKEIKGNDLVTSHSTMNSILGMNCVSYKFIIQKDGSVGIYGVTPENTLVSLNDRIELITKNQKSMTLIRSDGQMDNVGIVAGFRIKDSSSQINRDQVIGLCNDNGNIHGFYARGYLDSDRIIGEEVPSDTYSNYTTRTKEFMDPRRNTDIETEANSASARTNYGRNASLDDIKFGGNSLNSYEDIDKEASKIVNDNKYIENKNELMKKFYEKAKKDESRKI